MRKLHFFRSLFMTVALLMSAATLHAQEADKESFIRKFIPLNIYNKYLQLYEAQKHDPKYLKGYGNTLRIRVFNTMQIPHFAIRPKNDIKKGLNFDSDALEYIGADIGWNIFALGYSFGINHNREKNNKKLSYGTYTRFFAINAEILWLNNLNISNINDFLLDENHHIKEKIPIGNTHFRSRTAQLIFFPNGKRMAYGNTINPVFRQLRNAGTFAFSMDYSDYNLEMHLKQFISDNPQIPFDDKWLGEIGLDNLNMKKYELGGGYSYNFVAGTHWVFFMSDMVGLALKNYNYQLATDEAATSKKTLGLCNYFRTGTCYYNKDYFGGLQFQLDIDNLQTQPFLFDKVNIIASFYIGYKFRVDGFNRFVSKATGLRVVQDVE